MMTSAVRTRSLGCRFGDLWALRDCTFELPAGRVAAVVGPNGAGKTTLLNMLVGLLAPSEGEANVFGETPDDTPRFLARVGFVAQDAPLYRDFSAADHLRMGRHLNPIWNELVARERLIAADVPLERPASTLSGGQHAQLALAASSRKGPGSAHSRRTTGQFGPDRSTRVLTVADGHSSDGNHDHVVIAPDQ